MRRWHVMNGVIYRRAGNRGGRINIPGELGSVCTASNSAASEAEVLREGQALAHGPRRGVGASGRPRLRGRTALRSRLRRRRRKSHGRSRTRRRGGVSAGTRAAVGVPAERQRGSGRRRARRTAAARAVAARRSGPVRRKRQRCVDEARRRRPQRAQNRVMLVALRLRSAVVEVDSDGCGCRLPQPRAGGQQRAQLVVAQRAHDFHLRGRRGARVSPAGGLSTAGAGAGGSPRAQRTPARAGNARGRRGAPPRAAGFKRAGAAPPGARHGEPPGI